MSVSSAANRLLVIEGHLTRPTAAPQRATLSDRTALQLAAMSAGPLTSHVLDTASGLPAEAVPISLFRKGADDWLLIKASATGVDGRCSGMLQQDQFTKGVYKLRFDTDDYFKRQGQSTFYPYAEVVFQVEHPDQHYHVPLILSPHGYSTYRGS